MSALLWSAQALQAKFFGAFEHTLDAKGRITLPSRFRTHFGEKCFVTRSQYGDPCVVVWTPEDFFNFANQINSTAWEGSGSRRDLRTWAREAFETEIDRMGRTAIPQSLRTQSGLSREVLVQGAIGTIELWDPEVWSNYSRTDDGSSDESAT